MSAPKKNNNKITQKLQKDKRLKRFVIISLVIFSFITTLSFLLFTSCNRDACSTNYFNVFNMIFLSVGIIGLVYCFPILRDMNDKADKNIIEEYKDVLDPEDIKVIKEVTEKDNKEI